MEIYKLLEHHDDAGTGESQHTAFRYIRKKIRGTPFPAQKKIKIKNKK
jgi:hypothetical protein